MPIRAPSGNRALLSSLALAVLLANPGCRHHMTETAPAEQGALYPLAEGMTWTFRLEDADGLKTDLITRVDEVEGALVHITSGMTSYVYELREDGIYRPGTGAYLIKDPVAEGASWEGARGGAVTVLAVDETIRVPAGTFEGCVRIEETVPVMDQSQIHTFCPGVGPVRVEQFVEGSLIVRGDLIAHGPVIVIEDEP